MSKVIGFAFWMQDHYTNIEQHSFKQLQIRMYTDKKSLIFNRGTKHDFFF